MSDQEITDRDETRRLLYVALAARYDHVSGKMAELLGTIAHALTHHAITNGLAAEGMAILDALAELTGSPAGQDGPAEWARRTIDALSNDIEALKRPAGWESRARGVLAEDARPKNPRRVFLKKVYQLFDEVANNPDSRWFQGASSGDVMHEVEIALDRYDLAAPVRGREDLSMALDMLDRVLGNFHEKGHPGYEALRTGWIKTEQVAQWRSWVAGARQRFEGQIGANHD